MKAEEEYKDVSSNMRHYSDARFKRLTVFLIAEAALLGALFGNHVDPPAILLEFIGILVTSSFWIMTTRAASYYWNIRQRAIELEKKLEYNQYKRLGKNRTILNTSTGVNILFLGFLLLWVFLLLMKIIQS